MNTPAPRFTGRSARIRAHLVEHGKATMDQLHAACGEGTRRLTASSVYTLVTQGKVRRGVERGVSMYYPTPAIHIDGRTARRIKGEAAKAKKAATRAAKAPTKTIPAKPAAPSPWAFGGNTRAPGSGAERETVAEFLARGGSIERLPAGASATPLTGDFNALSEATWRRRQERLADHA